MADAPRIYIACLASYNQGILHGEWVDAVDLDEIEACKARVLRTSTQPSVMVDCPGKSDEPCTNPEHGIQCKCDCPGICNGSGKVPSAEEWAVHDYEGFGDLASMLGEYPDLYTVAIHGANIEEHGEAWIGYVGNVGLDYASAMGFEEAYLGEYDSEGDYASEFIEECHEIPDFLQGYIDFEAMARDWRYGGDIYSVPASGGRVHIFRNT